HQTSFAEHDHGAVVHGMMENRARQHESIYQRDGYADVDAFAGGAQHAARGRSMDVELVAEAGITGGNDERLPVDHEADVADVAFIENGVNLLLVVSSALGETPHLGSRSGRIGVHVLSTIRRGGGRSKEPLLLI